MSGAATLAVGQPLLELLGRAPEFFVAQGLDRVGVVALALLVTVVPVLLCTLLPALLRPWRRVQTMVRTSLLAILGSLIALAALRPYEGLPTAVTIGGAMVAGLGFAIGVQRFPTLRQACRIGALAVLVVPAWFLMRPSIQPLWRAHSLVEVTPGAAQTPVVMIIFDELALSVLLDQTGQINAHRFPHFADLASRATWYRRTAAAAETTGYAVPALLSGTAPHFQTPPIAAAYPQNLCTRLAGSHELWAFEPMSRLCPAEHNRAGRRSEPSRQRTRRLASDLGIVYLHRILPAEFGARLPPIDQGWRDFGGQGLEGAPKTNSPETKDPRFDVYQQARDAIGSDRRVSLDQFIESLDRAHQPAVHVLHTLLPHVPWNLTANGKHYPADSRIPGLRKDVWLETPFWIAQAYQRYIAQTQFADAFIGRVMARLEALGRFDETLVVVTADHGVAFQAAHHRRLVDQDTAPDILPIPLFVKAPGQQRGAIIDRVLSAVDVFPTLLDHLGVDPRADGVEVDGRSARDATHDRTTVPVLTEEGTVTPFTAALFDRMMETVNFKHSLFGTGSDPFDLYRYGPHAKLVGQSLDRLIVGTAGRWQWAPKHPEHYEAVDPTGSTLPVLLEGQVFVPRGDRQSGDLAFALNGTVAATMPLPEVDRINRRISIMLPASLFVAGGNSIEVFRIREATNQIVLHPVARVANE